MSAWMIWGIIGLLLIIAEMTTFTFYLLWIGVGALGGAIIAMVAPDQILLQIVVASVLAVLLTYFTRPFTTRFTGQQGYTDPIDDLLGKHGEVVEPAEEVGAYAIVRIGSESWSAIAEEPLLRGDQVVVVDRSSTVMKVQILKGD